MREGRRGGERGRGMKMQKGAGGLAQYWSGGASAFILFFVRRRVARSFLQDGRAVRARRCITSVTRTPSRERAGSEPLPCRSGKDHGEHPPLRGVLVVSLTRATACSETSILVREISEILRSETVLRF